MVVETKKTYLKLHDYEVHLKRDLEKILIKIKNVNLDYLKVYRKEGEIDWNNYIITEGILRGCKIRKDQDYFIFLSEELLSIEDEIIKINLYEYDIEFNYKELSKIFLIFNVDVKYKNPRLKDEYRE